MRLALLVALAFVVSPPAGARPQGRGGLPTALKRMFGGGKGGNPLAKLLRGAMGGKGDKGGKGFSGAEPPDEPSALVCTPYDRKVLCARLLGLSPYDSAKPDAPMFCCAAKRGCMR